MEFITREGIAIDERRDRDINGISSLITGSRYSNNATEQHQAKLIPITWGGYCPG